jgi:hypothetical protein
MKADKTALIVIDAQQECADGEAISADVVHRTHLGSLNGFLADIKATADVMR